MSAAEQKARRIVEDYLAASMAPDPERAATFLSPDVAITFTGGRRFRSAAEPTAFNAKRYRWVKKRFKRTDVVAGASEREAVVYNIGTLYGEWLDGTPFEGNRYVDRFVVRDGLIVETDVFNDSAEIILARKGLAEDGGASVPAAGPRTAVA